MGIIIVLKSWFCFNGQKSKKEICSVFTVVVYYSVSTHTTIYMSISLHCRQNLTQDYGCVCISCSVMTDSLRPHGVHPSRLLCPWNSPGKNTGVGCHFLLQEYGTICFLSLIMECQILGFKRIDVMFDI